MPAALQHQLAVFDRAFLIGLVQDLDTASKDNQAFLHTRFALGGDVLPFDCCPALMARLDAVRRSSRNFGYDVGDDMDALLAEYGRDDRKR